MSLRWKIALALAVVAGMTTITVGWIGFVTTRARLIEEVDSSLRQATGSLRLERTGRIELPERGLLDVYVQIVTPGGDVGDSSADAPVDPGEAAGEVVGQPGAARFQTVRDDGESFRVHTVGFRLGAIQVGRSLDETEAVLADVRRRTVLLVVAVTVAAAVLGWLIARTVSAPLARLTAAATDVERSGRLDVAVPVRGDDEAGRLAAAFNRMLGALAASRADQQRLVQDAGHELRTPLTSVRTNLAVLRRHPNLEPDVRDRVLADLHAETEELVVLVEEVVALASGAADENPAERVGLADAAESVAERARRRTGRQIEVSGDLSAAMVQRSAAERAISNLIDNAVKFDPSDAPIEVRVAAGRVDVADRGSGLPSEETQRIFDRFHRADAARSLPGSGLGLAIVRDIAERNGGGVVATDRDGGGAVVGFWLPVVP